MTAAKVQDLFTGQSKTAAASLQITGSKTVTVGNLLVVAYAGDDVGTNFGVTDNLGNVYTLQQTTVNSSHCKALLFTTICTVGGTLTQQTIAWTTNVTAKAAVSAEFSGIGSVVSKNSETASGIVCNVVIFNSLPSLNIRDLIVWATAVEDSNNTTLSFTSGANSTDGFGTSVDDQKNGTTGSSAASNIFVMMAHTIVTNSSSNNFIEGTIGNSVFSASALAAFQAHEISISANRPSGQIGYAQMQQLLAQ